jgi:hypothetical protein
MRTMVVHRASSVSSSCRPAGEGARTLAAAPVTTLATKIKSTKTT